MCSSDLVEVEEAGAAKRKAATDELRQIVAQEQSNAYVAALKAKADVKLKLDKIEQKQQ